MKILIVSACLSASVAAVFIPLKSGKTITADKGFAVIELFTSEGCSSCPPADALVARIQKESADKSIYILAYHVDYWNRMGWKDVFSSAEYTARQKQYARWLKLSQIYTPQAIVNGRAELVGSEEEKLRNTIKTDLQQASKAELNIGSVTISNDKAIVQYQVKGAPGNSTLILALVEKNATTKVERGENSGRTLAHVQIVRNLQTISLKNNNHGTGTIILPHGFDSENHELIGFMQDMATGEITGAAKAVFPTAKTK